MRKFLLTTSLMFLIFLGFGQNFSITEYSSIHEEVIGLMSKYDEMSKLICEKGEDRATIEQSFIPQFLSVFYSADKTFVYNDIDPTYKTSPEFSAADYARNVVLFYPKKGLSMELDFKTIQYGAIKFNEAANQYEMEIGINKKLKGWYMDEKEFSTIETEYFKITFNKTTVLEDFKIAGIRSAKEMEKRAVTTNEKPLYMNLITWQTIDENFKKVLRILCEMKISPVDKDLFIARQMLGRKPDGGLFFTPNAFSNRSLVQVFNPKSRKGIYHKGILIKADEKNYHIQSETGNNYVLPKKKYTIKAVKSDAEIKNLGNFVNTMIDTVQYNLKLESGVVIPVFLKNKDLANKKISVISPVFDNKVINYSLNDVKEIFAPIRRTGGYLGVNLRGGTTNIVDKTSNWENTGKTGFGAGIDVAWFFNENIGIGSGVQFNSYSTDQVFKDPLLFIKDVDNIKFIDWNDVSANFQPKGNIIVKYKINEKVTNVLNVKIIDVPLSLKMAFGKVSKINFYGNLGIYYSLVSIGSSTYSGKIEKYLEVIIDNQPKTEIHYDQPGAGNFAQYNLAEKTPTETITYKGGLGFLASAGVNFPFAEGTKHVSIGLGYKSALSSIVDTYTNMYEWSDKSDAKPNMLFVEIGYHFKL
jgi:hypothetical protein